MLEPQKQPLRGAARTDAQTPAAAAEHQEEREGGDSCVFQSEVKAENKVQKKEIQAGSPTLQAGEGLSSNGVERKDDGDLVESFSDCKN